MAKQVILSKESSESEIKRYFNAVLKLSQADNEFPINLDEVWPLVYPRKDHAVRSLKDNLIEGIDYQALPKNGEQGSDNDWGGNNRIDYFLTVPCMEFFIARKVRPVFEVYRKVLPVPDYTPSHGILKSATELLKAHNVPVSVQDFNKLLVEKGYLTTLTRKSSRGKDKPFKSITDKGLPYGENQVNPKNPKSTQPLWYEDKFAELLELAGLAERRDVA